MITKDSIETAYSFLHQKRNVYIHSRGYCTSSRTIRKHVIEVWRILKIYTPELPA